MKTNDLDRWGHIVYLMGLHNKARYNQERTFFRLGVNKNPTDKLKHKNLLIINHKDQDFMDI